MKTSLEGLFKTAQKQLKQLEAERETILTNISALKSFLVSVGALSPAKNGHRAAPTNGTRTELIAKKVKARFQKQRSGQSSKPTPTIPWFERSRVPSPLTVALHQMLKTPTSIDAICAKTGVSRDAVNHLVQQTNARADRRRKPRPFTTTPTGHLVLHARYGGRATAPPVDTN